RAFGGPFSEGEKSVRARRETHWNWQDNSFARACPRKDESHLHNRTASAITRLPTELRPQPLRSAYPILSLRSGIGEKHAISFGVRAGAQYIREQPARKDMAIDSGSDFFELFWGSAASPRLFAHRRTKPP